MTPENSHPVLGLWVLGRSDHACHPHWDAFESEGDTATQCARGVSINPAEHAEMVVALVLGQWS